MRTTRALTIAAVATAVAAAGSAPAVAADGDIGVAGSNMSMTTPTVSAFGGVTLSGEKISTTATLSDFTVVDPRGTGAGWSVTVQATQFTEHNGTSYVAENAKVLPAGSLTIDTGAAAARAGTDSGTAPTAYDGTVDGGSAFKVLSIAACDATVVACDNGMGTFDVASSTLTLNNIPAKSFAKTYKSDVTVTLVQSP